MADNNSPLRGRALITGGSSGLGLMFARHLARRGLDLVLVARNSERLEEVAVELGKNGVRVEALPADLSSDDGVRAVSERLSSTESPINVFVNNAGAGLYTRMATADPEPLLRGTQLMARAPMVLGGAAAAAMKERGEGVIINTSSMAAAAPMGAYSAIKAFVRVWSDSLAIEVGKHGVQVVSFIPGWVRTEFHERSGVSTSSIPSWLWLDADRVIEECLADVEKGKTTSTPSKRFKITGFLAKHAPAPAVAAVVKKLNKGRR
ncbi:short-subunit dehydrogenase [Trueperella bonasi]|uniref:Short-subunit dehydrogenase n=1 Tax=Trueperella bonasi TaxID=312286 RepID=A0ABT9NG84_9ACTO|nr:SDR family NAD(P)-dependent oxidoreductase [Trueperella bonasi]MDP9806190.1 short-subunit dehydrogenase [Trueperella bonasi]